MRARDYSPPSTFHADPKILSGLSANRKLAETRFSEVGMPLQAQTT